MRSISSLDYLDEATGEQRFPVVVQAAAQRQTQPLVVDDPDFPADCDSQPGNRIRVSAIYADPNDEAIPPEGSNNIRFITPTSEKEILACTDIYTPVHTCRDTHSKFGWVISAHSAVSASNELDLRGYMP